MDVFLKLAHTVEAGPHTNCKENPLFLISYLAASWRTVHEGAREGSPGQALGSVFAKEEALTSQTHS